MLLLSLCSCLLEFSRLAALIPLLSALYYSSSPLFLSPSFPYYYFLYIFIVVVVGGVKTVDKWFKLAKN
jgi:hypothetical protein